ncbi:uncharacterized protein TRAVEDRAFT_85565, partial [Trametes versicolor FP-101664 SS1]|uniref:uncharacterized protein n=1 Tax=Trametes versicolor (strain FP-101664) TaxID=717944 RepID=UPI000462126F
DVYAESLTYLGYGYPLWCPDTWNQLRPWDIEIGDVGWLRKGQFCPLIRTTTSRATQQPYGTLPAGHVPFDISRAALGGNPDRIMQSMLHSRRIQMIEVSAGLSASLSVGFKCAEDKGALLMLRPKGEEKICQSAGLIKNYLRANHKKWEDFANDADGLGLDLKAEDIIFVAGVTKTVDWGVTAFVSSQNEVEGSISCNLSGIGAASINVRVTNDSAASLWKRAGP